MTPRASTPTLVALFLALYPLFNAPPAPSRGGELDRDSGGENRPSPDKARVAPSEGVVKWRGKRISEEDGEGGLDGGGVSWDGSEDEMMIVGLVWDLGGSGTDGMAIT